MNCGPLRLVISELLWTGLRKGSGKTSLVRCPAGSAADEAEAVQARAGRGNVQAE